MRIKWFSFLLFSWICFLIISCDDPVNPIEKTACALCDTLNRSEWIDDHVSQIDQFGDQRFLNLYDSRGFSVRQVEFILCNTVKFDTSLDKQIIRWSGYLHNSCDSTFQDPLAEIESYQVIPFCPKPWPQLDFQPTLLNAVWQIDHILVGDSLFYPPCEMDPSKILFFSDGNDFEIVAAVGANAIYFSGRLDSLDKVFILYEGITTLAYYNIPVSQFEKAFFFGLFEGYGVDEYTPIYYKLNGSEMTFENRMYESGMVLRAIEKKDEE